MLVAGFDIGGTKISVTVARRRGEDMNILGKRKLPTPPGYPAAKDAMLEALYALLIETDLEATDLAGVGISCGGPLDDKTGHILSPPNLVGWDDIPITQDFSAALGVPVFLENDANACALAEWRFGAGRGSRNMVFLTFGTGFGAGLILDGRLYSGTNGMAGEVGHLRAAPALGYSPVGYAKAGSFEGFCSGGGITDLARMVVRERQQAGLPVAFCPTPDDLDSLSAKVVGDAAEAGDEVAQEIYRLSGRALGGALAVLVDLLNPEVIVVGSIYARSRILLEEAALEVLQKEALARAARVCRVVPAQMDSELGDVAALSIAVHRLEKGA